MTLIFGFPLPLFGMRCTWKSKVVENSNFFIILVDTLQIIGPTFPGVPGFPIGRTDKIAWGVTAAAVDVQDLFIMDVDSSGRYSYNGSLMEFSNITEVIKVKVCLFHEIESKTYRAAILLTLPFA